MKTKLIILISIILAAVLCLAACSRREEEQTAVELVSITAVEGTYPTQVNIATEPDFSGIKVTATYSDGTTKTVGVADGVTVGDLDTLSLGTKSVTVSFGGKTTKVEVSVIDPEATAYVMSIKLVPNAIDATYHLGQIPDMSRFQVEATYSTGKVDALPADAFTYTPIDTTTVGKKTLTVTYTADPTITTSAEYEVIGISSMLVETGSVAKKVNVGQSLDTSAIKLIVEFVDGSSEIVEAGKLTIGTIDTTTYGVKNLDITYMGVTIQYSVEVVGLVSLEVNQGSYNAKVNVGATYSVGSITAKAKYSDNTEVPLSAADLTVGALDTATAGEKDVTVSFGGATVTIKVTVVGVETLTVVEGLAHEIFKGEALNTADIVVNVKFTDGTTDVLHASDLTFGAFDVNVAGDNTLAITYLDKTINESIKVCSITSLRVEGVNKVVQAGEDIVLDNMVVYGVYNDANETEVKLTSGITTNKDSLDINSEEDKILVVSYNGELGSASANVVISATAPALESIEVKSFAQYVILDGSYDKNSINVYATYSNGAVEKVTGFTVSNLNTSVAGKVNVTVTYTEGGVTKTATIEISVLPITKVEVIGNTVADLVNRGAILDTSKLKATIVYSDGVNTVRKVVPASALTVATPDTATEGNKSFKVSYKGVETSVSYYVRGVASIAILGGSVDSDLRAGYSVDYSGLILDITYSNGDKEQIKASQLTGVKYTGTAVNSTTFGVEYEGKTASMSLALIKVVRISALNNTIPALVNQGQSVSYANMRLSVYYDNGDVYLVPFTDSHITVYKDVNKGITVDPAKEAFDTSKSGWAAISFKYEDGISFDKDAFGNPISFTTSVNVLVRGVAKVEIVGGVLDMVLEGKQLNTADISVKVTYDDGTYIYVTRSNPNLIVKPLDTSKPGKTTLTVEFYGVAGTKEITVKEAAQLSGLIFGVLLPDELVARESYKNNFKDNASAYRVGDDNPYYFYLNVIQLDENDNIVDVDGKSVPTAAEIYMDGAKTALAGADLDAMVKFNSTDNSYDFTDAAIGHTFRIVIRPADSSSYIDENSVTKETTVLVVDGYNVYDAKELNVITNMSHDLTDGDLGTANSRDQLTAVNNFLAKNGIVKPAVVKGIVLHCNLDVGMDDVPPEYFYEYTDNNGQKQIGMFDAFGVFSRVLRPGDSEFAIYGNYFSIYSYDIPTVLPKGVGNNGDDYSSADLFYIRTEYGTAFPDIYNRAMAGDSNPYDEYKVTVQDVAARDNDPNSNDQTASERHMRGLRGFNVGDGVNNFYNVNIEAYMTSVVVEDPGATLNLNKCTFYNAWQGHLFLWNRNVLQHELQGKDVEKTWNFIGNLVVNIKDSYLTKCGGPVILAQTPDYNHLADCYNGVEVHVTGDSKIETNVTGQEAWFVAVGQTALAAQIRAMSPLVGAGHGYISTNKIQGVETVNMVFVSMVGSGVSLAGSNLANTLYTVNGEVVMRSRTTYNDKADSVFVNSEVEKYLEATSKLNAANGGSYSPAPVYQSSAGGVTFTDGKSACQGLVWYPPYNMYVPAGSADASFYQGDYISLFYNGAGILMEYIHG